MHKVVGQVVLLGAAPLLWFVHERILNVARAIFAMKALGAIGINVLGMDQTLKNAIRETGISQILESWELE